jgi:hypothetical protein
MNQIKVTKTWLFEFRMQRPDIISKGKYRQREWLACEMIANIIIERNESDGARTVSD